MRSRDQERYDDRNIMTGDRQIEPFRMLIESMIVSQSSEMGGRSPMCPQVSVPST